MKKKKRYNVAVVGVGAVGTEMLRVLKERRFPIGKLVVLARSRRRIKIGRYGFDVEKISPESFNGMDFAIFAGTEGEKGAAMTYAREAVKRGAVVIDNGADFRLKKDVPLVVPEVNGSDAEHHSGIIANPNCSTIQMAAAIAPIYRKAGIKRIIVSTYQAVSGAGRSAIRQLWDETRYITAKTELKTAAQKPLQCRKTDKQAFPRQIAFNVLAQIGGFKKHDYTSEEWKMVDETRKIFHDKKIKISATCVRVPALNCHCEAVYLETKKAIGVSSARNILRKSKGIIVIDNPARGKFPMPVEASAKDEVFVGRLRRDPFNKNGLWLWVVSDNLRKGAATNAIQIAEYLIGKSE